VAASHPAGPAERTRYAAAIFKSELTNPLDLKQATPFVVEFEFCDSWRPVLALVVGVSTENE
jgi:hypothetical protein